MKFSKNQKGFTLLEIFIAFSLFAVFATVFLQTQTQNVFDSQQMGGEIILKQLCEGKINEILINPPEFTNADDGKKETKDFDFEDYKNYSYTIEYKKFKTPDLTSLMSDNKESEELSAAQKQQMAVLKTVFETIGKKIEEVFWQVRVTTTNKDDSRSFELSTWMTDPKAKFELNIPLLSGAGSTNGTTGASDE